MGSIPIGGAKEPTKVGSFFALCGNCENVFMSALLYEQAWAEDWNNWKQKFSQYRPTDGLESVVVEMAEYCRHKNTYTAEYIYVNTAMVVQDFQKPTGVWF